MVKLIVWVFIGLLALSFFGISLQGLFNSPTNQENMSFLTRLLQEGWTTLVTWLQNLIDPVISLLHLPF